MKKTLSMICLFLCAVMLLSACDKGEITDRGDNTVVTETNTQEVTTGNSSDLNDTVTLVKDGEALFCILAEDKGCDEYAERLQNSLLDKMGINFTIVKKSEDVGDKPCMRLCIAEPSEMVKMGVNLTYSGYGTIYYEGDLYFCAYDLGGVGKAVLKWTSSILDDYLKRDGSRTLEANIPKSTLFVYSPKYPVSVPKLLGAPLSDYVIVVPASISDSDRSVLDIAVKKIGLQTGVMMTVTDDTTIPTQREIRIGNTCRTESVAEEYSFGAYTVKSDETCINIGYGGALALYCGVNELVSDFLAKSVKPQYNVNATVQTTLIKDDLNRLSQSSDVTIMSSNMLFAIPNDISGLLNNDARMKLLGEYYLMIGADSVGLQECIINDNVNLLTPVITDMYAFVPYNELASGEKIIYRKDKQTLIKHGIIDLGSNYAFMWALFENKTTSERYIHANLHYHYDGDAKRLLQAEKVNEELKKLYTTYADVPIFVTGDYNTKINSSVHSAMTEGVKMKSAVELAPDNARDYKAKSFHTLDVYGSMQSTNCEQIDHIMVTWDRADVILHAILHNEPLAYSTDHCPIIIKANFKK